MTIVVAMHNMVRKDDNCCSNNMVKEVFKHNLCCAA